MRNLLALVIAAAFTFSPLRIFSPANSHIPQPNGKGRPVIVELFTSEGCSSCPPADALLLRLENSQPIPGANVIAIEEHVDYWNHQGWTDPYSSSDWTLRQVAYVEKFKGKEPYTPQTVVDGETQVVGGQESQIQQVIQREASQPQTEVMVTAEDPGSHAEQQFRVRVSKLASNSDGDPAEVWLAVTESGLGNSVTAGENAGQELRHASVLRSLHKIGVAKTTGDSAFEGTPRVKFKPDWKKQNLRVVVFVQGKKSMRILGAASVKVAG
ncbi:MAG: DUF1223 domain-containing protein [Candidatus Acidiferrum sp.]